MKVLTLLLFLALVSPAYVFAFTYNIPGSPSASDEEPAEVRPIDPVTRKPKPPTKLQVYKKNVDKKFSFGMVNFLAGWTDILSEPAESMNKKTGKKNRSLALLGGFGAGLITACTNTAGGFVNALTAPIPQLRIPLPHNGVDLERLTGSSTLH